MSSTSQRVFRFKWANPTASSVQIGRELHLSSGNVRQCLSRLRKKGDLSRLCPDCFAWRVFEGVCQSCGAEVISPKVPLQVDFGRQSPTNHIHAGNLLGSEVDLNGLHIKGVYANDGLLLKRRIDRTLEDGLTRAVKSEVMEWLKGYFPAESVTDYAGRLCEKEVSEFRTNYPILKTNKHVKKQLAVRVVQRLRFLYPALRRPQVGGVTV